MAYCKGAQDPFSLSSGTSWSIALAFMYCGRTFKPYSLLSPQGILVQVQVESIGWFNSCGGVHNCVHLLLLFVHPTIADIAPLGSNTGLNACKSVARSSIYCGRTFKVYLLCHHRLSPLQDMLVQVDGIGCSLQGGWRLPHVFGITIDQLFAILSLRISSKDSMKFVSTTTITV